MTSGDINLYRDLARSMIDEATASGFLEGELMIIPEIHAAENTLFPLLFQQIAKHLEQEKRNTFTEEELLSLFTYMYAKGAEAVGLYCNHTKIEFDHLGMFDGKVPLYAPDGLVGYFKTLSFPEDMFDAFRRWREAAGEDGLLDEADPLLLLFEALKWTWRIAVHLAVDFLESNGHHFREKDCNN